MPEEHRQQLLQEIEGVERAVKGLERVSAVVLHKPEAGH